MGYDVSNRTIAFKNLSPTDHFVWEEELYMKTEDIESTEFMDGEAIVRNAVSTGTGTHWTLSDHESVQPVEVMVKVCLDIEVI